MVSPPKTISIENPNKLPFAYDSFTYLRTGGFSFLYIPIGFEIAMGHRFHGENTGYGPLVNVSYSGFAYPAISFKYELLHFPKKWDGAFWGIMPGAGIMYTNWIDSPISEWDFCPTLEFIYGKEFTNSKGMPRFYYYSLNPLMAVFSFNYGWGG